MHYNFFQFVTACYDVLHSSSPVMSVAEDFIQLSVIFDTIYSQVTMRAADLL